MEQNKELINKELAALTEIRRISEKNFMVPFSFFDPVENLYLEFIALLLNGKQEILYDEDKQAYVLEILPSCKVCGTVVNHDLPEPEPALMQIYLRNGKLYICKKCYKEIVSAKPIVASLVYQPAEKN